MANKRALLLAPRLSSLLIHWKSIATILKSMGYSLTFIAKDDFDDKNFLKKNDIEFIEADISPSSTSIFQQLNELIEIKNIIKNKNFDVIHAFYLKGTFLASLISFFYRSQYFFHICGLGSLLNSKRVIYKVYSFFVMRFLGLCSRLSKRIFIFETKFLQNSLETIYGFNPKNTYVTCGVGVDVNKFKPFKSSEVIEGSELKCVLVSRLLKDKGINEYIEASKALSKSYNQLTFTLIGSEDPHSPMKLTNADMNNLRNSPVKYISHIDNINEHLPKYDIFILPSYHEGLSVSSMEAGACGLVLLLSDIPGCRELVVEGYNGFTFKKQSSEAIIEKLQYIIDNKKDIQEMSKNSREYISKYFSYDILNGQIKHIYKENVKN